MIKLEDVHLIHFVPGRVRFRIEGLKGDWSKRQAIQQRVASVPGISNVEVNPITGSVVMLYDATRIALLNVPTAVAESLGIPSAELTPDRLATWCASQDTAGSPNGDVRSAIEHPVGEINREIDQITGNDLRLWVPVVLAILGMRSLVVSEKIPAPSWHEYFWFAFSTFFILNQTKPRQ